MTDKSHACTFFIITISAYNWELCGTVITEQCVKNLNMDVAIF